MSRASIEPWSVHLVCLCIYSNRNVLALYIVTSTHTCSSIILRFLRMFRCEYVYGFVMTLCKCGNKYVNDLVKSSSYKNCTSVWKGFLCAKCLHLVWLICVFSMTPIYIVICIFDVFWRLFMQGFELWVHICGKVLQILKTRWLRLILRSRKSLGKVCSSTGWPPNTFQEWQEARGLPGEEVHTSWRSFPKNWHKLRWARAQVQATAC